jgi:4-amino-4-deoxy-L-arabinose transferase-like glycosyltransferase
MTDDVATTDALREGIGAGNTLEESPEVDDVRVVPDPNEGGGRRLLLGGALTLSLVTLFGTITASGIWEPPELKVADLARRIAVTLMGAKSLALEGSANYVPTAGELGRGELPYTSVALGLKLFGLSEWAGRLPMALWGLAGVLATYLLLARLVDKASGAFAAIVLITTPLFFLQARSMLGEVVTMSALAIATAGFALAVFDARPKPGARFAFWLLGVAGAAAGFGSRGVLIGVALPAGSVALAWLIRRASGAQLDRLGAIFGVLTLLFGLAALGLGIRALVVTGDHEFSRMLGATLDTKFPRPTHDAVVLELGHALFPWSALVPLALGRLLSSPPVEENDAFERESAARLLLLVVAVVAFGTYDLLAPTLGVLPFGAVFALAGAVALMIRDFERGAPGSRTVALAVVAFLVLLCMDFKNFPEKGLVPFGVDDAKFPDSFKERGTQIIVAGTVLFGALFALFFVERDEGEPAFAKKSYLDWPRSLRRVLDGNVLFGLIALEVGLAGFAVATFVSDRWTHWAALATLTVPVRLAAEYGPFALPVVVLVPTMMVFARDLARVVLRKLRVTRGAAALCSIAAFGAVMSFGYYHALATQMSPKEVFESFRRFSRPGEELAMMGAGTAGARYYAHRDVPTFASPQEGFNWLVEKDGSRRWLVVRANDIAQVNSLFRAHKAPARNLPVLDARSSEIMLVSNELRPGETNQNPFSQWLLDSRPVPARHVDADFGGQLHAIGWDITTPDGAVADTVRAGKSYVFRLYYEVTRPVTGEWQTFIHIDGYQRRFNGDHDTLDGKYPFHLWHQGDFVVDTHPFELEPNFTAGTYEVFFGLFHGDQRFHVTRGGEADDRVRAGALEVR